MFSGAGVDHIHLLKMSFILKHLMNLFSKIIFLSHVKFESDRHERERSIEI